MYVYFHVAHFKAHCVAVSKGQTCFQSDGGQVLGRYADRQYGLDHLRSLLEGVWKSVVERKTRRYCSVNLKFLERMGVFLCEVVITSGRSQGI